MLRLFSSRGEHPLADERELQRVIAELAARPAEEALGEAVDWLGALPASTDLDLAARMRVLAALDEAVQAPARQLEKQFILTAVGRGERAASARRLARQYWASLVDRYAEALAEAETARTYGSVAELAVRLLRASTAVQRWDALRYGRFDMDLWRRAGHALLTANALGASQRPVRLRASRANETTVEREYLRAVALATASLAELDEMQIGLTSKIIHYVLPALRLTATCESDSLFWIDPALGQPPTRVVRQPVPSASLLFFGGGTALDSLIEMETLARTGAMPPAMGLDTPETVAAFVPLLRHLIRHWSTEPPVRRHRRHPLSGELHVVEGMERVLDLLGGHPGAMTGLWTQRDASLQGIGATVTLKDRPSHVRIRGLLALRATEGDRWLVGIIRRLHRISEERLDVGIELLSWNPLVARADDGATEFRVLLLDPLQRSGSIRLAVPHEGVRPGAPLYLIGQSKALKLLPGTLLERGVDHEIRSYQLAPAS